MDSLRIEGGARLTGSFRASGAKNAALPCLAATLLTSQPVRLTNVPALRDIRTMTALLAEMGARLVWDEANGEITLDCSGVFRLEAPYELVRTMRASVLCLGPLVARYGHARVSLPGGCAIGERPIDQHLAGIEALGARIDLSHGYVDARARRLVGARIPMGLVTVTGTMNVVMAASLARGESEIDNAACEPEVVNLCDFLRAMGAEIEGDGTPTIHIQGREEFGGGDFAVMADRIEAGTYLIGCAMTGGTVSFAKADLAHLALPLALLRRAGVEIAGDGETVQITGPERLTAVDATTAPYPAFPTDLQAQWMAAMATADGVSVVREEVFENRFMHVAELMRMGADIRVDGATAVVRGVDSLSGAPVMATDLRASASLVLAGLIARGETCLARIYHLDRGYEHLEEKLAALGARVVRERG
ncbi:MAG: UDP-N-acetylglucosamine 1-carboxyvinyltransferase [Deltaproteobacteria bacterium]|nr:UDP-N-acetylglucosamine 1-carboxyvinyltransferase [Deltaproteobacteria bacterium]NCS74260.1 UDP-N-acetylglucosamine 1-carboxyvinyltransferase [Deltaproteobacteria bacterium]PIU79210.1 MAG: UDP-N-acetylglucosamine 1-carboxyvinyltransferase [Nitrospirae bacterium CG06_land_8_20_14_3_00_70_43]